MAKKYKGNSYTRLSDDDDKNKKSSTTKLSFKKICKMKIIKKFKDFY